jgi:hypothetical protein
MRNVKALLQVAGLVGIVATGLSLPAEAAATTKLTGTRFEMTIPDCWAPGYKDLENLFMVYFKDPKSGAVLEGVYLRGTQPPTFTLADFKKARIDGENKRYDGKDHKVAKEGDATIAGEKGVYLHTTWKDGSQNFEKHTALYLKDGNRYLVVLWGPTGKVNKKLFDEAVKTFALAKP